MNILNLPEKEIDEIKNRLLTYGLIVEKNRISKYDQKFFEIVTLTKRVVKFFLFFSLALYIALNIFCIALSVYYKSFNAVSLVAPIAVSVVVFIITFAIFGNINTNKKTEENVMYVIGDKFVFNFSDGVTETPRLFYSLSYDCVVKIEFTVDKLKKSRLFGRAVFTFLVEGYEVTHTVHTADLSQIEQVLNAKFPSLTDKLIVDGRNKDNVLVTKTNNAKYFALSFGLAVGSVLSFVLPRVFNVDFITFKVLGAIFAVTAIAVFASPFICLCSSVRGLIVSAVFVAIGYLVPTIIFEIDGSPILQALANGNLILLPTFFGNIGLCLYASVLAQITGKIIYIIKSKKGRLS